MRSCAVASTQDNQDLAVRLAKDPSYENAAKCSLELVANKKAEYRHREARFAAIIKTQGYNVARSEGPFNPKRLRRTQCRDSASTKLIGEVARHTTCPPCRGCGSAMEIVQVTPRDDKNPRRAAVQVPQVRRNGIKG